MGPQVEAVQKRSSAGHRRPKSASRRDHPRGGEDQSGELHHAFVSGLSSSITQNQGIGSLKKWSTKHRLLRAMGKENEPTPAEIRAKKRQARKLEQRPAKIARKIAKQEKKRKIKEDKEKLRLEKGIKKLSTAEKKELRRKKRMENGEEFRDKSRKRTSPRMIRKRERDRKQSLVAAASGDAGANQVIGSGANRQALGGGGKNRQERRQNGKWGSRS